MKVNVAGAGAGKTTRMANLITDYMIPNGQVIFCIAFTNAAANHIKEKVVEKLGKMPNNIKISTIHSFLYHELIEPYYFFLYGKQFERLSVITLPTDVRAKAAVISELEASNILHITAIPARAKWVAYQKSSDKRATKDLREKILARFKNYCAAIFVDEAQDINEDISIILSALDKIGIEIILYGDPKQDVKGLGLFRQIVNNSKEVNYITNCYRCPSKHLALSNMLAPDPENQIADESNANGSIVIVFESDIKNVNDYVNTGEYGLRYISMKRDRYATHDKDRSNQHFEALKHEVYRAIYDKWKDQKSKIELKRIAFYVTERMLKSFNATGDAASIIRQCVENKIFDRLPPKSYMQMISAFTSQEKISSDAVVVSSIEMIKGLEAKRCLFVLTTDLAPYLFRMNTEDNKTSHLLYVALTRSLDNLTILITNEVEGKYTKNFVIDFFRSLGAEC